MRDPLLPPLWGGPPPGAPERPCPGTVPGDPQWDGTAIHMAPHNTFICPGQRVEQAPHMFRDLLRRFRAGIMVLELDYADPWALWCSRVCNLALPIKHWVGPAWDSGVVDIVRERPRPGVSFYETLERVKGLVLAAPGGEPRVFVVSLDAKRIFKKKRCHGRGAAPWQVPRVESGVQCQGVTFKLRGTGKPRPDETVHGNDKAKECRAGTRRGATRVKTYHDERPERHADHSLPDLLRRCGPSFPAFDLYTDEPHHHMLRAAFCADDGRGGVAFQSIRVPDRHQMGAVQVTVLLSVPDARYTNTVLRYFTATGLAQVDCAQTHKWDLLVNRTLPVLCAHAVDRNGKASYPHAVKLQWDPFRVLSSRLDAEPEGPIHFCAAATGEGGGTPALHVGRAAGEAPCAPREAGPPAKPP